MFMKRLLLFSIVAISFLGCKKTEGDGGAASVRGHVFVIDFKDDFATKPDTMIASEEDIYIVYGSNEIISDKSTTNESGEYGFDYLRKGNYSIIAYSKIPETDVDTSIVKKIKITDKKATVQVENIYLYKAKTGYATITGRLWVEDYNTSMVPKTPVDHYFCGGENVYIQKVGSVDVLDKETTGLDGYFMFKRLSKGTYKIYAWSKSTTSMGGGNGNDFSSVPIASVITCSIDSIGQQKILSDTLKIIK